jgi:hypothetical protein
MKVYMKNAMLGGEGGVRRREMTGPGLARTGSHLNMIRMYVTWSIPVPFTNWVSSSVADMNNRPPATRNYRTRISSSVSSNWWEWGSS